MAAFRSILVSPNCTPNTTDGPLYVPESGGHASIWIDVHPACAWVAHIETPWLQFVTASAGSGPGAVTIRGSANGEATRSGRVAFADRIVEVVQQGFDSGTCTWSLDDRGKTFDASNHASSVYVNAPAECAWRVTAGGDFIDVAGPEERTGPGTVFFSVENNPTTTLRRGVLRLDGRLMMVTQYGVGGGEDAPGCSYSVVPTDPTVGPGNGQHRVWVATASGCPWTAQGGGWLHALDGTSRSGPGWLTYAVENNTAPELRTGVMTVAGRTVTVRQRPVDGCGYAVDPLHLEVSSGNDLGTISVSAHPGCTWSAERTGGFIHLTETVSGTGAGVVAYRIENNTTTTPRTGELRIAGFSIPVSQMAVGDCAYHVSPMDESIEPGNQTRSLYVSTRSDCRWAAAAESAFLGILGGNGERTALARSSTRRRTTPRPNRAPGSSRSRGSV